MEMETKDQQGRARNDEEIEKLILWSIGIIAFLAFMVPIFLSFIIFAVLQAFKKEAWTKYVAAAGVLILFIQGITGKLLSYLAVFKEMNIPYVTKAIESLSHKPLEMNFHSYLSVFALSMVFSMALQLFAKLFWKKPIHSKQEQIQKVKASGKYQSFRKKRVKFLQKQQLKYRQSESKEIFLGYTDLQERVEVPEREFNYHMLAVGGTGTGKTTLIASVMEGALRKGKPIIFVDGKGERASMQDFKRFCEDYGKKVYMFSEYDSYTYNPIKYGTPTEIRDKLMNLFEWSEPYYKNFSSRYLQLIVQLINKTDLKRDMHTVFQLLSQKKVEQVFKDNLIAEEYEVEVPVIKEKQKPKKPKKQKETEEIKLEKEPVMESQADPFASLFASVPPETEEDKKAAEEPVIEAEEKETEKPETKIEIRTRYYLPPELEEINQKFDEIFEDDNSERNLNGLRNQLGELLESDLGHLFRGSENEIDLRRITDEENVVIFSISGNKYRDYIKKLGKIIILDVNSLVAYRQETGRKATLAIYDEFSAYGNGEIVDIVNKSRSAGFECIISTQTLADIDAVEPFLTSRILSNCNILATGRVNDSEDAEKLANQFSTFTDTEITSQIESKNNLLKVKSERGTVKTVEAFIAHPKEIKSLQIGEIFLARKMEEEGPGTNYTRRVYVRNALEREGILKSGICKRDEIEASEQQKQAAKG